MSGNEDVNLDDPYVIAEKELRDISAVIQETARKLAVLKPRQSLSKQADESLNFEDQILEAAKSITAAVATLVKAATEAQKELVAKGGVSSVRSGEEEAKWSQGLIAAARLTATATGSLCEDANAAVRGDVSEEKLVTSARAVADSTRQLLVACKTDGPESRAQKGLQSAGAAVEKAAGALVDAATGSSFFHQVDYDINDNSVFNDDFKEELEIQELILKKEKELVKARAKLDQIREMNRRRNEEEEELENI